MINTSFNLFEPAMWKDVMANGRMLLRHKITGKYILLATYSGHTSGWESHKDIENIDEFFEDHFAEFDQKNSNDYELIFMC